MKAVTREELLAGLRLVLDDAEPVAAIQRWAQSIAGRPKDEATQRIADAVNGLIDYGRSAGWNGAALRAALESFLKGA